VHDDVRALASLAEGELESVQDRLVELRKSCVRYG
jgi:hypothetical protein